MAHDWFLTRAERGNPATTLHPWTEGNQVRPLVDGAGYMADLAAALEATTAGDEVLLAGWRVDADERLTDTGPTVAETLAAAARRGVAVRALIWRSHRVFAWAANRETARLLTDAGAEVVLDHRVRAFGSQHQKIVVVRHPSAPERDVAYIGGIDLAHGRRDTSAHHGDPQGERFRRVYPVHPPWHDVQVALHGPAVDDVVQTFRERWHDGSLHSHLPWARVGDRLRGIGSRPSYVDPPTTAPQLAGEVPADAPGTCGVQVLRTYPHRRPRFPFAPHGERSVARAYAKALRRARRLVYVEDQYLWSVDVARVFARALARNPELHLVAVVPRFGDQDDPMSRAAAHLGRSLALEVVLQAGPGRVLLLDVENERGEPVYVHAKVCIIDDVWASVGSDNLNRRSWSHDAEATVAVLDDARDPREPTDPAGMGDGARVFARELRLRLWREHLGRLAVGREADLEELAGADPEAPTRADDDLIDPLDAVDTLRAAADALDDWHAADCLGPRPPGRLRHHRLLEPPEVVRPVTRWLYLRVVDPAGGPRRAATPKVPTPKRRPVPTPAPAP